MSCQQQHRKGIEVSCRCDLLAARCKCSATAGQRDREDGHHEDTGHQPVQQGPAAKLAPAAPSRVADARGDWGSQAVEMDLDLAICGGNHLSNTT